MRFHNLLQPGRWFRHSGLQSVEMHQHPPPAPIMGMDGEVRAASDKGFITGTQASEEASRKFLSNRLNVEKQGKEQDHRTGNLDRSSNTVRFWML